MRGLFLPPVQHNCTEPFITNQRGIDTLLSRYCSDREAVGVTTKLKAGHHELAFGRRTLLMGIINMTPDSFSGDGLSRDLGAAVARIDEMVADGADIIDVGGESTRPGAVPVEVAEEIRRVLPLLKRLRDLTVPVSIDTRKADVARAAIDAGASIVNDIWGLRADGEMAHVLAEHDSTALVVMHNQRGAAYGDLLADVTASLRTSMELAETAGIDPSRVIVDPGFGFGKTPAQNLEVVQRLGELRSLGRPVLLGASNKSTLTGVLDSSTGDDRRDASLAIAALAIARGVDILRVHDVKGTNRVRLISDQIVRGLTDEVRNLRGGGRTL